MSRPPDSFEWLWPASLNATVPPRAERARHAKASRRPPSPTGLFERMWMWSRAAADMILVFNRRRSPVGRLLHESVAQQVVSGARIPVVAMPIIDAGPLATTAENEAVE